MTKKILVFEIPEHFTVETLINCLAEHFQLQTVAQYNGTKTFYDSFDWQLYGAGFVCEVKQTEQQNLNVNLINYTNKQLIFSANVKKMPNSLAELKETFFTASLPSSLNTSTLLPIACLNLTAYQFTVCNRLQRPVAQLTVEEYASLKKYAVLQELENNNSTVKRLRKFLFNHLALSSPKQPFLIETLKARNAAFAISPDKVILTFKTSLTARQAVFKIYQYLLDVIKYHEQNAVSTPDSESLHDFRVAVRKTRTALTQLKIALPAPVTVYYAEYFAWLGQITTPSRDLEVYLVNFADYKKLIAPELQEHLQPLQTFLQNKHTIAQKALAEQLSSEKYLLPLISWQNYLKQNLGKTKKNKSLSVKQLADERIWKVYRRVLRQGGVITEQSLPENLHELRKTCKKLRYLIEFFQSLYVADKIKTIIQALKELQEVLGNFQDYAVQQHFLHQVSDEMHGQTYPEQTFLAIAALVEILQSKSEKARGNFAKCFAGFASAENQRVFRALFNKI